MEFFFYGTKSKQKNYLFKNVKKIVLGGRHSLNTGGACRSVSGTELEKPWEKNVFPAYA